MHAAFGVYSVRCRLNERLMGRPGPTTTSACGPSRRRLHGHRDASPIGNLSNLSCTAAGSVRAARLLLPSSSLLPGIGSARVAQSHYGRRVRGCRKERVSQWLAKVCLFPHAPYVYAKCLPGTNRGARVCARKTLVRRPCERPNARGFKHD